ncbi:MAG TPA: hypothetical protein VML75_23030 [Kofleriaceae bacterium]|nr:hypothetical protein [Kofleriaceae bacterium]
MRFVLMILATASFLLVGCGGDGVGNGGSLVGGSCSSQSDCDERCLTGGDYPQGTCAVSCDTNADCPEGTQCVDKEGGVCLLSCTVPAECRGGYTCKGEQNKGHGGDSLVCIQD